MPLRSLIFGELSLDILVPLVELVDVWKLRLRYPSIAVLADFWKVRLRYPGTAELVDFWKVSILVPMRWLIFAK